MPEDTKCVYVMDEDGIERHPPDARRPCPLRGRNLERWATILAILTLANCICVCRLLVLLLRW